MGGQDIVERFKVRRHELGAVRSGDVAEARNDANSHAIESKSAALAAIYSGNVDLLQWCMRVFAVNPFGREWYDPANSHGAMCLLGQRSVLALRKV